MMTNLVYDTKMVKWTKEQKQILKEQYKINSIKDICVTLNKSKSAIIMMAQRLKIKKKERWTAQQIKTLIQYYPISRSKDLTNKINKTEFAIIKKATLLGLKKRIWSRNRKEIDNYPERTYNQENSFCSFIAGFVAGEGSFIKLKRKNSKFKFCIALADDDEDILKEIKEFFGTGTINKYPPRNKKWKGTVSYNVGDILSLIKVIIPFFDKYHFFSARKQKQYVSWRSDIIKSFE